MPQPARKRKRKGESEETVEALTTPHPRVKAYAEIIEVVKREVRNFYNAHPNWREDERAEKAIECNILMVGEILETLDGYDISYKIEEDQI